MTGYEIELGQITENRDARTDELLDVTVDVYVQEAPSDAGVGDFESADHQVTFDVQDGRATFRTLSADPEFTDLALMASKAAAHELDDLREGYEVEDPVRTIHEHDYSLVDERPERA